MADDEKEQPGTISIKQLNAGTTREFREFMTWEVLKDKLKTLTPARKENAFNGLILKKNYLYWVACFQKQRLDFPAI